MSALRGFIWMLFEPIRWLGYLAFMAYASWFIGWKDAEVETMRKRSKGEK